MNTPYTAELEGSHSQQTFTVEAAEITDTLENYEPGNFYDYSRVEPWLLEDGSLKSYTRQHYENGVLLDEETVEQCFLRVKVKASQKLLEGAEDWDKEVALDASLCSGSGFESVQSGTELQRICQSGNGGGNLLLHFLRDF